MTDVQLSLREMVVRVEEEIGHSPGLVDLTQEKRCADGLVVQLPWWMIELSVGGGGLIHWLGKT